MIEGIIELRITLKLTFPHFKRLN